MTRPRALLLLFAVLLAAAPGEAAELSLGPRIEYRHPGTGHEVHLSGVALAAAPDGGAMLSWIAQEGHANHLYFARAGAGDMTPVRVNPDGLTVEALHHPPRLAVGPSGEVYLSWASLKTRPEGTLFASDLRLSRSTDGGRTFDSHLRVNDDRPISHSFEGLTVAADGTVVLAWIDGREGRRDPGTYVARVVERGTRVEPAVQVGADTCVCCRVDVVTGPGSLVALGWRKVFPDDIRDMVLAVSRDGGRSFGDATLISPDRWKITACPHRGGSLGVDGRGRIYAAWYTEGTQVRPDLLFAVSEDGRRFARRQRLHTSATSIPDHARMAVDLTGRAVIVWEDATAVRRRVLLRHTADAGRTLGPVQVLSRAVKAWAPDVAFAPDGRVLVAWQEEQFPRVATVVQTVTIPGGVAAPRR